MNRNPENVNHKNDRVFLIVFCYESLSDDYIYICPWSVDNLVLKTYFLTFIITF